MLSGKVVLELTSADIPGFLRAAGQGRIALHDVTPMNDLVVRFTVHRRDVPVLCALAKRRGESMKQIKRLGSYWRYRRAWNRPVLLLGILLLLTATVWLPTRVLFVRVTGNETIPERFILEQASQCGIGFGGDRGAVRSEKMKNALLDAVPELQWAGVNTSGCIATITVRERQTQQQEDTVAGIGHIVAALDGIILECTVSRGTAVCRVGQAVRAGQVLISGYTDCGIAILSGIAQGDVVGETGRQLQAATPEKVTVRGEETFRETKFSLLLGKNRINFYEDSGILDSTCVKMITECCLTLPGGFELPVTLVREEWVWYDCRESGNAGAEQTLRDFASAYLLNQMTAGEILASQETVDGCVLYGNYICREMIGQIRYEEIIDEYGKDYGENSERRTR